MELRHYTQNGLESCIGRSTAELRYSVHVGRLISGNVGENSTLTGHQFRRPSVSRPFSRPVPLLFSSFSILTGRVDARSHAQLTTAVANGNQSVRFRRDVLKPLLRLYVTTRIQLRDENQTSRPLKQKLETSFGPWRTILAPWYRCPYLLTYLLYTREARRTDVQS